MLVKTYTDISFRADSPFNRQDLGIDKYICARFHLDNDISPLFPYINRVASSPTLIEKPPYIKFMLDGFLCGLYPDHGVAALFTDRYQALDFLERLLAFLNDLDSRRNSLKPYYKTWKPVPVLDIFRLLPGTNCRKCGYATCMAFAAALSMEKCEADCCPELARPIAHQAIYPVVDKEGNLHSTVAINITSGKTRGAVRGNPSPGPLTARELEVLRLLSQGATNPEISAQLQISPHTVKSHIINIFNKLGVDDRTQAAVWAARQDLV